MNAFYALKSNVEKKRERQRTRNQPFQDEQSLTMQFPYSPSFGDVKRLIEERDLFTTDEVKELKAQLKAKAVEICDEVSS